MINVFKLFYKKNVIIAIRFKNSSEIYNVYTVMDTEQ